MSSNVVHYPDNLYHHGVKGMKWGIRRYVNYDGTLTAEGKAHYAKGYTAREAIKDNIRYGSGVNNYINRQVKKGRSLKEVRRNLDVIMKSSNIYSAAMTALYMGQLVNYTSVLYGVDPAARKAATIGAFVASAYGEVKSQEVVGRKASDKRRSKWEKRTGWDLSDAKGLYD